MRKSKFFSTLLCFCLFYNLPMLVSSYVMSIDFGTDAMKVAVVRGGGFEIALNDQSRRKTPTTVAFNKGDRLIGVDARNLASKTPLFSYSYTSELLGKTWNDPSLGHLKNYITYNLLQKEDNSIEIAYDEEISFTPEDIVAILLKYAQEIATKTLETPVKEAVIIVPPYWNQYQRQGVLDAAKIAGVNVLSLLNQGTAVALHWGLHKTFEEGTSTNVIFYDMGASHTVITLDTFTSIPEKGNKTINQVQTTGIVWDDSLGGRDFDRCLASHFLEIIKEKKGLDLSNDARAMVKLLKEAEKVKTVLSANQESVAAIESLTSDYDFRAIIKRETFEKKCEDLFDRAASLVLKLFEQTEAKIEEISAFEIVGGGVRIPKLQQKIQDMIGRDLDRHLNGDEAAALGGAYYAAIESIHFRVKETKVKDSSHFTVHTAISSSTGNIDKNSEVFKSGTRFGAKKSVTFSSDENITALLRYDGLDSTQRELLGKWDISIPSQEKYNYTGKPRIHLTYRLDSNGFFTLESSDAEISIPDLSTPEKNSTSEEQEDSQPQENSAPKLKVHVVPLTTNSTFRIGFTEKNFQESKKKLREIEKRVEAKKEREREKNSLEGFIYEMKEKLESEGYQTVTTPQEREDLLARLGEAEEWLYSEGSQADAEAFRSRLRGLKTTADRFTLRLKELEIRDENAQALSDLIEMAKEKILTESPKLNVTEGEVQDLLEELQDVQEWLDKGMKEQAKREKWEDPVITTDQMARKWKTADALTKAFLRKPKKKVVKEEKIIQEEEEGEEPKQGEQEEGQEKQPEPEQEHPSSREEEPDPTEEEHVHDEL